MAQYIGLSFSLCIKDIAAGRIPLNEVIGIRTGTFAETPDHWEEVITQYRELSWFEMPDECERIARHLLSIPEAITQPRLDNEDPGYIGDGWWIRDGELVQWCNGQLMPVRRIGSFTDLNEG